MITSGALMKIKEIRMSFCHVNSGLRLDLMRSHENLTTDQFIAVMPLTIFPSVSNMSIRVFVWPSRLHRYSSLKHFESTIRNQRQNEVTISNFSFGTGENFTSQFSAWERRCPPQLTDQSDIRYDASDVHFLSVEFTKLRLIRRKLVLTITQWSLRLAKADQTHQRRTQTAHNISRFPSSSSVSRRLC
jgi:hypothetical protein